MSRLGEPPRRFEGTLEQQTGRFELRDVKQSGSLLRGILLGGPGDVAGIGEWLHDGLTVPVSFDRFYPTYPMPVSLPNGARVVPVERFQRGAPDCPTTCDVFPRLEGVAMALPLSHALETTITPLVDCFEEGGLGYLGGLWSGSTYTVTASSARWVALAFESNSYMGGVRGSPRTTCAVADTQTGKLSAKPGNCAGVFCHALSRYSPGHAEQGTQEVTGRLGFLRG